jgi:hypothetical protein
MAKLLHKTFNFLNENKLVSVLIFLTFISSLRILLLPLSGDELTYAEIARNIMSHGEYSHHEKPSTITPSLPFLIALFYTKFNPVLGFVLAKLTNLLFLIIGLRYLFLFLKKLPLNREVIWVLILLTIVNTNFVVWSLALYPEAILFCFFWIFIYYLSQDLIKPWDIFFILISFGFLVLTRYVYAVFGIMVLYVNFNYLKNLVQKRNYFAVQKIFIFSIISLLPLLFWFKYVYNLEKEVDTGLSYFARFKNNEVLYNLKAGIGLIKHDEAGNVNGIPAFISLFLPITGYRNWILSIILILGFVIGFISKWEIEPYKKLFIAILLVMFGLIFAGTGFSRYWLPMLPGYLLGFYLFFNYLKLKDSQFVLLSKIIAVIYVLNELRLDVKIFSNHL